MSAMQVVEPGRDRAKYLGGSDVAAMLGLSKWRADRMWPRGVQR